MGSLVCWNHLYPAGLDNDMMNSQVAAPAQVLQHYPSYAFSEQSSQNVAPVDGEATDITGITLPEAAEITLLETGWKNV